MAVAIKSQERIRDLPTGNYFLTKYMKFTLSILSVISFATICALAHAGDVERRQVRPIPEAYFIKHKGDFDNLQEAWIAPQGTPLGFGFKGIEFADGKDGRLQLEAAKTFLENEFERFCVADGVSAITTRSDEPYIFFKNTRTVQCSGPSGISLAKIHIVTTRSDSGTALVIYIVTKKIQETRGRAAEDLEKRKLSNGPSGVVTTDRGTYQFERFGTLERRYVAVIDDTYVEDIKSIEFQKTCCDIVVVYRDGSSKTFNSVDIRQRESMTRDVNLGSYEALAFVLKDARTGLTYQDRFNGGRSHAFAGLHEWIKKIEFSEPNASAENSGGQLWDGRNYMKLASPSTSESELQALINQYALDDRRNLLPAARKRLAELQTQKFASVSKIGTRVCRTENGQIQQEIGSMVRDTGGYRDTIYSKAKPVLFSISGYVEGVNEKRIKVTITSISRPRDSDSTGIESLNELPPKYTKGLYVWDEFSSWSPCD